MPTCAGPKCRKKLDGIRYRRDWCSPECWQKGQARGMANIRRFRAEQAAEANPMSIQEQLDAGLGDVKEGEKISEAAQEADDPELPVGTYQW